MENIEKLRNDIAHSQTSIIEQVTWEMLAKTISRAEAFLMESDVEIEKDGVQKSFGFNDDVLLPMES